MSFSTTQHASSTRDGTHRKSAYDCLPAPLPQVFDYRLCSLRERDIEGIRRWRNAQMTVLRQAAPISKSEQVRYFEQIVRPTFSRKHPNQILLSFLRDDVCIGYSGLTNIDWNAGRAEISFLLDSQRIQNADQYACDFEACLTLLSHIGFELLGLNRLFAETYDIRPVHIKSLERYGYVREGCMRDHVRIDGVAVDALIHGLLEQNWRDGGNALAVDTLDPI